MDKWNQIPSDKTLTKTATSLKANGFNVIIAENKEEAKQEVLNLIPKGAEVMNMTSVTLDSLGIPNIINIPDYDSVRNKLNKMDRNTQSLEMQKLGAAPEWAVGSVNAITEEGQLVIASNTGSQLSAYAGASAHVIWVVGAQKIVPNLDDAFKRIYEHTLPLEGERAHKAYGVPGSFVSKVLIINREINPNRGTVIIVKEILGF